MSSKHFPGLPPYVDPGFEAKRIPEDVRGGLCSAWPVRRVEDQLAALATIDAIPGDQRAALNDAFRHAIVLIAGQVVMIEGQIEAATLLAAAYGLDDERLREIEAALKGAGGEDVGTREASGATSPSARDLYIAKAKELEAKLDEAVKAMEAAETRAKLSENAASKARTDIALLSSQVANLRSTIATREAEFARVKAGFEKALKEAKDQAAEASKPKDAEAGPEVIPATGPVESPPAIILPPGVEATPEALPVAESPPAETPSVAPEIDAEPYEEAETLSDPSTSSSSRPAKNGRKAR